MSDAGLGGLLDTTGFVPRWQCGDWPPALGWTHVVSDALIFGAYAAIPACLLFFVQRRKDAPFPLIFYLFFAFILSCGLTHLIEAAIFWEPVYRLSAVMKAITAVVSWATVLALFRTVPRALELPGLRVVNEKLSQEVAERQTVQSKLEHARAELEQRSSQLTLRDRRMREAFGSAMTAAVQWDVASGKFVWQMNAAGALRAAGLDIEEPADWEALLGHMESAKLRREAERALPGARFTTEHPVTRGAAMTRVRISARVDSGAEGDGRTATCMFRCVSPGDI